MYIYWSQIESVRQTCAWVKHQRPLTRFKERDRVPQIEYLGIFAICERTFSSPFSGDSSAYIYVRGKHSTFDVFPTCIFSRKIPDIFS